jgi:hypothetical protein
MEKSGMGKKGIRKALLIGGGWLKSEFLRVLCGFSSRTLRLRSLAFQQRKALNESQRKCRKVRKEIQNSALTYCCLKNLEGSGFQARQQIISGT